MNSDELSISSVMTMYFTAQRQGSTSSPPEPIPDVRQGVYVKERSGKSKLSFFMNVILVNERNPQSFLYP